MKWIVLLGVVLGMLLAAVASSASAEPLSVTVDAQPDHVSTVLGGPFTLKTEIVNTSSRPTGPILAHLNVASIQGDVYVDPEDWSSNRSQNLSLQPGESRTLSWDVQAVNAGRFAAYVVVLPEDEAVAGAEGLVVSPLVKIDVAARSTFAGRGTLPVVLGIPIVLGLIAGSLRFRPVRSRNGETQGR
jgi:hypothetical protein